jgi:hypothetical protein
MIHFSSPATAEIMMFDEQGKTLIELMGHRWSASGAIAADDVPAALQHLRKSLEGHGLAQPDPEKAAEDDENETEVVELQRRAFPLIAMLEAAAKKKSPVLWRQ